MPGACLRDRIAGKRGARTPRCSRFAQPAIGALLLAIGLAACTPEAQPRRPSPVYLIGIDGASWDIIDELRAEGRLPNFDALIARGARGELVVPQPSISPSLWTTIATGVDAERHRVVDFWATSADVRAKRVWQIADEAGLSTGLLGYLITWPPAKANGFLVPGWLAQDTRAIPDDVRFLKEIEALEHTRTPVDHATRSRWIDAAKKAGARPGNLERLERYIDTVGTEPGDAAALEVERRSLQSELSADVFCGLIDRFDPHLAIFYQHHVDAIEHLYFAHYRPEAFPTLTRKRSPSERNAIPAIYQATDRSVGRIVDCAPDDARFVIVSDHGQKPGNLTRFGMPRIRSSALLERLGIADRVFATNIGDLVFLRPRRRDADLGEFRLAFERVRWASNDDAVFQVRDHQGLGLQIRYLPSTTHDPEFHIDEERFALSDFIDSTQRISGTHTDLGVLLMVGPGVREGVLLQRGHLLDVAPTLLALLDLPLGRDMPGRPRLDALREDVRSATSLRFIESHGIPNQVGSESGAQALGADLDEATRKHLEALGYLE